MLDVLVSMLMVIGYCVFIAIIVMSYFFAFLFAAACYTMKNYDVLVGVLVVYSILTYAVFELCR